jgi:hypothetical protein
MDNQRQHDENCPGCTMARRREINVMRLTHYKTLCTNCRTEIVGELEHRINGEDYCDICVSSESP